MISLTKTDPARVVWAGRNILVDSTGDDLVDRCAAEEHADLVAVRLVTQRAGVCRYVVAP